MDAGLVVVLAATGVFLLVPLVSPGERQPALRENP
jgi:hypothetical protein